MADILANPVEICFGSFTATSTTLAAATSPAVVVKIPVTPVATPGSNLKLKSHDPDNLGLARLLELEEIAPQMEVWSYAEVCLAKVDEGGDDGDRVQNQVYQLDEVEEEKVAEEV
jgi:hypothetical protein